MALTFALPPGAAEPHRVERWSYDRDTGIVRSEDGRVEGGKGRATKTGFLAAAAPMLREALKGALVVIDTLPRPADLSAELAAALDARRAAIVAALAQAEGRAT